MLAPFRWCLGGRLGDGRQWIPWVALDDAIDIASSAISDERYSGPINVVAPNPVRNADFTRIVADVLHRPAIFPAPAFALRFVLGEMAEEMLLASLRVRPNRLLGLKYSFHDDDLEPTLRKMLT
jgi:NAD dependent epimerase/dehydratase family enzyme